MSQDPESVYELSFDWCGVDKVDLPTGTMCSVSKGPWGMNHVHGTDEGFDGTAFVRPCGSPCPDNPALTCEREGEHDTPGLRPADWLGNIDHGAMFKGTWKWWPNKHKPSSQREML